MDVSVDNPGDLVFGNFRLDPVRRVLRCGATPVKLTPREFEALLLLARQAGGIVDKEDLMAALWPERTVEEGNLSQTIFTLRKALAAHSAGHALIVTAPGRGYRFAAPVHVEYGWTAAPGSESAPQPDAGPAPIADAPRGPAHRWRGWAIAGLAATALAAGLILLRPHETSAPPAASTSFDPPPHSVAVLAFSNMSGDSTQDYFGDGLAEELINALGRIPAIHVAARVSTFSFKNSTATIEEIARKLNVGAVLEGSVRREGDALRISAHLIDARTGFQLWSRTYDRNPRELLQVEGDIALSISRSLEISIGQGDETRLTLGGTSNPEAFDAYLLGMQLLRSNDDAAIARGRESFDKAILLDPGYARAYAGLAYALCDIGLNAPDDASAAMIADAFRQALAAADKAIALAPDLASGHAARAEVLDNGFARMGEAEAEAARARELQPGDAAMAGAYAQIENDLGHFDNAIQAARLATTLDPLRPDTWYVLDYILSSARRNDEALAALEHERVLRGGALPEHTMEVLARIQLTNRDFAAAEPTCRATSSSYRDICRAIAEHGLGKIAEANATLTSFIAARGDSAPYNVAEIYAQWRDAPNAIVWLEKALKDHDPTLAEIRSDPLLDPIKGDPGFKAVEQALNLPP